MNGSVAALVRADDAVYIDTTGIPISEVVTRALAIVKAQTG